MNVPWWHLTRRGAEQADQPRVAGRKRGERIGERRSQRIERTADDVFGAAASSRRSAAGFRLLTRRSKSRMTTPDGDTSSSWRQELVLLREPHALVRRRSTIRL